MTTMTQEERQARIAELQGRFASIPSVSGGKSATAPSSADAAKVIGTVIDTIGHDRAFELRGLDEATRDKLRTGFGIAEGEYTAHSIGQALAMTMRRCKETEVAHKGKKYVLMNQPGEGTKPSRWCVFLVDGAKAWR